MIKQRIYIDTSVIGGCFDEEFQEYSEKLFEDFLNGSRIAVVSNITLDELQKAPANVYEKLKSIPDENIEYVSLTTEAGALANMYIEMGVLTKNQFADSQHIAIASIEKVDVIVSWNFKHIVNLKRIHGYNSVNIREGYQMLEIRSPREVLDEN